ncbi:MAG: hypothetical protein A2252_07620 [Elusimicrobia bacterium RIFOXYA2_FULL_39_19]|nr:MAG: hypothetical protein A2252_07620 [Elusimicrobia bacterium RIFOXYA2_FULL_39_19]
MMKNKICLNGSNWFFKDSKSTKWFSASVPGCIHTDLAAAGKISDPFYGTNEKDLQWISGIDWDYKTRFDIADKNLFQKDRIDLLFEGIDTFAQISLNGKNLGRSDNMFHEYRFDVKSLLKEKNNILLINFKSPLKSSKNLEKKYGKLYASNGDISRVYARKAQYSYGWDWGPCFTTSGLYKGVSIEGSDNARIISLFAQTTEISSKKATLKIDYEIDSFNGSELEADLKILFNNTVLTTSTESLKLQKGRNEGSFKVEIKDPQLWYPNGYGKQPLYKIDFQLKCKNKIIDSFSDRFGIRKIQVIQDKDSVGRTFIFEVNGIKIFSKGYNWIPADSFLPNVTAKQYKKLLNLAKESNANMMRIWGGGIYEDDQFYKTCDELGLLVWQDFMFACAVYPGYKGFLDSVTREANYQIRRLRNHPCIALWCGNNENEAYKWDGWDGYPIGKKTPDETIFYKILPGLLKKLDPATLYWPSSPWGYEKAYDSKTTGDSHSWEVWNLRDYTAYSKETGRFISEFGFQSMPNFSTIPSYAGASERALTSEVMENHNKQIEGTSKLYRHMALWFPVTEDLKEFVFRTQMLQGQALKYGIEHWRRRKFKTAGALIWQLNDCWPVASWSLVDYSLKPKLSYAYIKKVFSPLLVSIEKQENGISVWLINDTQSKAAGKLTVSIKSLIDDKVSFEKKLNVSVNANTSKKAVTLKLDNAHQSCGKYVYAVFEAQGRQYSNALLFKPLKYLRLGKNEIKKIIHKYSSIETKS